MKEKNLFRVQPILIGEFGPVREDIRFRGGNPHNQIQVPSYLFYLESGANQIIVDTGFYVSKQTTQLTGLQCQSEGILKILEEHSIDPRDIEMVICTHLHWDHIGNLKVFNKAKIVCQRSEIAWAFSYPNWEIGYLKEFLQDFWNIPERIIAVDGKTTLQEGLTLVKVGGHTPGSQAVVVETPSGKVIIPGDLVMSYENLEKEWPIGLFWNLGECIEGMKWIKEEKARVLPGHDWNILNKGLMV